MTNREFADKLLFRIERHKNVVCTGNKAIDSIYVLAHEHITEIIKQELRFLEEMEDETRARFLGVLDKVDWKGPTGGKNE